MKGRAGPLPAIGSFMIADVDTLASASDELLGKGLRG